MFKMTRLLIILVPAIYVIFFCLYNKNCINLIYKELQTHRITKFQNNTGGLVWNVKPKVLILTSMKSGSLFLGQLFATNPDIFYMFEPLHSYGPAEDIEIQNELKSSAQSYGFNCVGKPTYCRLNYLYSCQIHQFFKEAMFVHPKNIENIHKWFGRIFGDLQRRLNMNAEEAGLDYLCSKTHKIIVIKTIRIDHIEEVVPLIRDGVKVCTIKS